MGPYEDMEINKAAHHEQIKICLCKEGLLHVRAIKK